MRGSTRPGRGRRRWLLTGAALALIAVGCATEARSNGSDATAPATSAAPASSSSTLATATTSTLPPTTTTTLPPPPPSEILRQGATGPAVEIVQRRLEELGFRPGSVDGHYGDSTYAAVMAFQKYEGLDADGHAGPITQAALGRGLTAPGPRGGAVPRIEVDIDRQVAFVVAGDGAMKIINVSSGNEKRYDRPQGGTGVATTPRGTFKVQRRVDGIRVAPLGKMYRPMYFKGGYAVHGSSNVPGYPASHGCVRTTNPDQDFVFSTLPNGAQVEIYGA